MRSAAARPPAQAYPGGLIFVQVINALVILGCVGVAMVGYDYEAGASILAGLIGVAALVIFAGLAARQMWALVLGIVCYSLPAAVFGIIVLIALGRGGGDAGCVGCGAVAAMSFCLLPVGLLVACRKEI
jgi:hypothetical protein